MRKSPLFVKKQPELRQKEVQRTGVRKLARPTINPGSARGRKVMKILINRKGGSGKTAKFTLGNGISRVRKNLKIVLAIGISW